MKIKQIFSILLSLTFILMLFSGCQAEENTQTVLEAEEELGVPGTVSNKQWKNIDLQVYPVDLQFTECAEVTLPAEQQTPEFATPPTEDTPPKEIDEIPETTQATQEADSIATDSGQFQNNETSGFEDVPALDTSADSLTVMAFRGQQYTDPANREVCCIQIQHQDGERLVFLSGTLYIDEKEVQWDETEQTVEDVSEAESDGREASETTETILKIKLEEALLGDLAWISCAEVNTYAQNQELTMSMVSGNIVFYTNDEQTVFQVQSYDIEGRLDSVAELSKSDAKVLLNGTVGEIPWNTELYPVMHLSAEETIVQDDSDYRNQFVQYKEAIQELQQQNQKGKIIIITLGVIVMLLVVTSLICLERVLNQNKQKSRKSPAKRNSKQPKDFADMVKSVGTVHNIGSRSGQQDSFDVVNCAAGTLAVVADGMGGLTDGDKVSQKIVATMRLDSARIRPGQTDHVLCQMVAHANQEVNRMLGAARQYKCGSTLLAVLVENNTMQWITVGDSRIYLYRGGNLIQINREHVYCAELLEKAINGKLSFAEVLRDPQAGRLSSFIGMGDLKHVDICLNRIKLCAEDKILLMSDGVFNTLSDEEIARVIQSSSDAAVAAAHLEQRVLQKNAPNQDNFTCVILEV